MDAELKADKVVEDVQGHSVVFCFVGIYMNVLSYSECVFASHTCTRVCVCVVLNSDIS